MSLTFLTLLRSHNFSQLHTSHTQHTQIKSNIMAGNTVNWKDPSSRRVTFNYLRHYLEIEANYWAQCPLDQRHLGCAPRTQIEHEGSVTSFSYSLSSPPRLRHPSSFTQPHSTSPRSSIILHSTSLHLTSPHSPSINCSISTSPSPITSSKDLPLHSLSPVTLSFP